MTNMELLGEVLNDTYESMNSGLYDFTDQGKCSCCGQCCGDLLPVTDKEIDEIKKYVKIHKIKAHSHGNYLSMNVMDLTCPFMDSSKELKCTIYPVRPQICKMFSCHKENRKKVPIKFVLSAHLVSMRNTFFNKGV